MPGFADVHAAEEEIKRLQEEVATVRQKLHGAVRKGKAIDAERQQCIVESESRGARLAQAEQRIAALEEQLKHSAAEAAGSDLQDQAEQRISDLEEQLKRCAAEAAGNDLQNQQRIAELQRQLQHAAEAAGSELREQLSAALERCTAAEAESAKAREAAKRAVLAQRDAEAKASEAAQQLTGREASVYAQATGEPLLVSNNSPCCYLPNQRHPGTDPRAHMLLVATTQRQSVCHSGHEVNCTALRQVQQNSLQRQK